MPVCPRAVRQKARKPGFSNRLAGLRRLYSVWEARYARTLLRKAPVSRSLNS